MALSRGTRIGDYEVLGLLGAGGMGEVYEARDGRLGRSVALKVLPAEVASDPERLSRFEREARAVAALNHPNIVTLYGLEETGDARVLVMERVSGRCLSEILEPGGLPVDRILDLAAQIAEALGSAHERGVVHRDVKPGNVMVTEDGRVKVLDFGLARMNVSPSVSGELVSRMETLTQAGQVFGTVPYMAPEQLRGEQVDARTDIFSFGAVLYEMAAGRPPFRGQTPVDVASAILREEPVPLSELRKDLPAPFLRIVRRCLEKEPRRRAQSALDLHQELRDLSEQYRTASAGGISPAAEAGKAAPALPRKRTRRLLIAAGALVVAGGVALLAPRLRTSLISPAGSRPIRSIAVMPFANLAHDSSQDYFVEGMHDALITELAKLGAFAVTSRATVFAYKGSSKPAKQIAQELGVDALIEGSALRSGKKVRITAQLIRGTTDEHLWAESYDRDLEDVLGLLNDVSRAIANEVQTTLARGNRTPLPEDHAAHRRVLPEAYDLHLRAHSLTMGLTSPATADFLKILELHRRSVELDPNFAEGWTGVAFTNLMLGFFRRAPAAEVIPRAREAALKALTLDEGQGGAQGVLGTIDLYFDWNFESAKSRLERAVALNPHSFGTRHAWADYLMVMGRFEESLAQVKLARSYEPASPLAHAVLLFHGMATRRYDEFIAEARRSIAQFPKFGMLHGLLAEGLWRQGRYAESIAEEKESFGADSDIPLVMQSELERAGPNAAIKAAADRLAAQARAGRGSPLTVAACYADAGERDSAFQWLEKVYAERVPQILHIVADPSFDGVRNDPRYTDLMRRIGIPARPLPGT